MIDEKFYLDKKLLAMTKKEIKSYRMKKPLYSQGALWLKRNKFCYYFLQKSLLY